MPTDVYADITTNSATEHKPLVSAKQSTEQSAKWSANSDAQRATKLATLVSAVESANRPAQHQPYLFTNRPAFLTPIGAADNESIDAAV